MFEEDFEIILVNGAYEVFLDIKRIRKNAWISGIKLAL
jgi:hypothetical protein